MKKRNWFWNIVIVLTVMACVFTFVLHYQNWSKIEEGHIKITSGIYRQAIPISKINSLDFVKRIPEMQRRHGFSWLAKEKGVFNDSITGTKVYVFVDDLNQQKIRLIHHDSLQIYLNFSDSLKTQEWYERIKSLSSSGVE